MLSAGATTSAFGAALLQEVACFVGASLDAARTAVNLANEVAAELPVTELQAPLAALAETRDAFEAGLA